MKLKHYICGFIIILFDQISKFFIIDKQIQIIPNILNLTFTKNSGAAFGISNNDVVLPVSIIIIITIIIFLILQREQTTNPMPYILILAGSIGNLIDRFFRGYVIDFININFINFPNFNIADISIVIGFFYLIYIIIFKMNSKKYKNQMTN